MRSAARVELNYLSLFGVWIFLVPFRLQERNQLLHFGDFTDRGFPISQVEPIPFLKFVGQPEVDECAFILNVGQDAREAREKLKRKILKLRIVFELVLFQKGVEHAQGHVGVHPSVGEQHVPWDIGITSAFVFRIAFAVRLFIVLKRAFIIAHPRV